MSDDHQPPLDRNPWEDRDGRGWPRAFLDTLAALIREPRTTLAATRPLEGSGGPLIFGVTAGLLGWLLETAMFGLLAPFLSAWLPVFQSPVAAALSAVGLDSLPGWAVSFLGCQLVFLAIPLAIGGVLFFVLLVSLLTHLGLLLVGGARDSEVGFRGTLVVTSYAMVASLAQFVPFLGDLAFLVGLITLQVIGLQAQHRTSRNKAVAASLAPMALILLLVLADLVTRLVSGS